MPGATTAFTAPSPLALSHRAVPPPGGFLSARPRHVLARCARPRVRCAAGAASPNDGGDGGGEDAAPSSIDWDSDWSNFRSAGMASDAPPGRAPPTAQERAARKAAEQVRNVTSSLPTRQALFADWRFWAAVLLSLSVFTALVGNSQANAPLTGGTL